MLTSEENAIEKTDGLVGRWLAERSELLVLYFKLTGTRNGKALPEANQISQFCDILIDYVSAGHFEVYEQLVRLCDTNGPQSLALLEDLYPKISQTTDIVVDFNDRYSGAELSEPILSHLDHDLSTLGEAIASRVDLEDKLIDTLNNHH